MKRKRFVTLTFLLMIGIWGCSKALYPTNGENIYRRGKNLSGKSLLSKAESQITVFKSCQGCHGRNGDRIKSCNIQWQHLSDPSKLTVPYTEALFYRFIDEDLKSDGSRARTGTHWQMTIDEKKDLMGFLTTLK